MEAREIMEAAVRRELFGPTNDETRRGKPLDISAGLVTFESWEQTRGPWHDAATGQEILSEIEPLRRYGVGVLHPKGAAATESIAGITGLPADDAIEDGAGAPELQASGAPEADTDDFDLSDANSFKPSAMGVSFKVRVQPGSCLRVEASAAAYEKVTVRVQGAKQDREWWVRRPFKLIATVSGEHLLQHTEQLLPLSSVLTGEVKLQPQVQAYSRPVPGDADPACRLVTVALVNRTNGDGSGATMFQTSFEVRAEGGARIEAYPELPPPGGLDDEEESIALLYRKKLTYAVGHGCAATWDEPVDGASSAVRAEPLPAYEVPSLTPEIPWNGGSLRVSMAALAAEDQEEGRRQVELVLDLYARWIRDREKEIETLDARFHKAARRHIQLCNEALARMRRGWELATSDPIASRAFRLANEAMLSQQVHSRLPLREVTVTKDGLLKVEGSQPRAVPDGRSGYWRPFQIAFILATLPEIVHPGLEERDTVDLIFFPTGGGKTEAYLGAAALSMIARRLRDKHDAGTDVLMRYTLRLLTAQQFLRAAALICALEEIRSRQPDLGSEPFSIGIWLGSATTPNTWSSAKEHLSRLRSNPRAENPFLLLRCPWCGARMGPVSTGGPKGRREVAGYVEVGRKVKFRCPDAECRFGSRDGLPVSVVDEDIYERRPTLVIGTVDKFAMLAWRPQARALFGLDGNGQRIYSPPGLIIQDELHLISGPLGSMVGLYEPVIEDLCTDLRSGAPVRPKIVASTATIRRYEKQIRDLYGREKVALFPPQGLEEGHSFFAEPATLPDGSPAPGRRYLGVMSPSLGSIQTVQVRVAAATLQAGRSIPEAERDAYWTNLNFLNSLRELGNTVSLLQSDIPDYLTGMRKREGIDAADVRWPRNVLELTSRRRSDEIPKAIEELQREYGSDRCVDVCLASNIIEVGVDIDRLALMTVVGQPKTTAQYIQISGRVGRRWDERPGLVIVIYGAAKPRDRSHYERFVSYHQRLYAQVEPTSLTPFALPVLQRGMHGAIVAHIRQSAPEALPVYPFPEEHFEAAVELLKNRAALADTAEVASLESVAARRAREWSCWERTAWDANPTGGDPLQGLMRYAGTSLEPEGKAPVWEVPTSMRNVDAECLLQISAAYAIASSVVKEETE
ncbi:helicase [Carbonactinospora thermoautotrophica]|uniref:Helicase n=1 Tax=Carbonactinospora thermoautotrophica TaxID=1469144 RepID=A0A132N896_9ACTN|nr:helicase-related protein [Carbonactinospora thermoautotrophica]KWW97919.1 helicase [Carbonactinospora thermoautotrophica]KWX06187.1 helicase [Carbonactinospora thermoautotrophica]